MRDYKSNEEFFKAFRDLVDRIERGGDTSVANELREGFACLNGLTDGWAQLMESIERAISEGEGKIAVNDLDELRGILKGVRRVVYRR